MLRATVDLAAILWAGLVQPSLADDGIWFPGASNGDEVGPGVDSMDRPLGPFNWSQVVQDSETYFYAFDFNASSLETAWAHPLASTAYTKTGTPGYNLTIAVTSVPGEAVNTGFGILSHPDASGAWPMAAASIKGPDLNLSYACLTLLIYNNATWQGHAQGDDGSCQTALLADCLKAVQDTTSANTSTSNCDDRAASFLEPCQLNGFLDESFSYSVYLGPQNKTILDSDVLWSYTAWNNTASVLANTTWPVIMTWATDNGSGTPEFSTSVTCARANFGSTTPSSSSSGAPSSTSSSSSFAKPTASMSKSWLLGGSVLIGAVGAVV